MRNPARLYAIPLRKKIFLRVFSLRKIRLSRSISRDRLINMKKIYVIDGIAISPIDSDEKVIQLAKKKLQSVGISQAEYELNIYKKSVDARKKDNIRLVYSVCVKSVEDVKSDNARFARLGARAIELDELEVKKGREKMCARPLVGGMGPAGLFCALVLAENGYRPIIIEHGDCIKDRVNAVERFCKEKALDTESNIQFGAGGAGTFSDGKLLTRINDPKCTYVLETLRRFGAPEEVTVKAKPHIGTDVLRGVVDNMLAHIEKLGGDVIYRCKLTDIAELDGRTIAKTTKGDFECSALVLALGHSARDTYGMLLKNDFSMIAKPISVGVRIEHKRSFIEEALYGKLAGHKSLSAAEYALSDTKGKRGVYTFCMCPGGEVVAAASEEGGVVVNGMSVYARDGENSNSAVAVSIRPEDFEEVNCSLVLGAIEYQRRIERAAFVAGGSNYSVPVQTVGDFMSGKKGTEPSLVMPSYMGGNSFKTASMDEIFPSYVTASLRYALGSFDKKIKGFAMNGALLSGAETRTSSPVRILRAEDMRAIGRKNIYPCGEGAGYAGGITSAAVDGIKTALAIASRFNPEQ